MPEPTITQNGALYAAQHTATERYEAPRRRWLSDTVDALRNLRVPAFGEVMDVRRLHLGER